MTFILCDSMIVSKSYLPEHRIKDDKVAKNHPELGMDGIMQEKIVDLEQQKRFLIEIDRLHKKEFQKLKSRLSKIRKKYRREKTINKELQKDKKFLQHEVILRNTDQKRRFLLLVAIPLVLTVFLGYYIVDSTDKQSSLQTTYVIENLRGDIIDTWKMWKLSPGTPLTVNIINSDSFSREKIDIIKNAILSEEEIKIDGAVTHKVPKGTKSTYNLGWAGALKKASKQQDTKFYIPQEMKIIESPSGEGDILVRLANYKDGDGNTGFTKSTVSGNEILKSAITIFDVNQLSNEDLATITRHELGHALGLAHSTDPNDLMSHVISTEHPYISECNVQAIIELYDGKTEERIVCEI